MAERGNKNHNICAVNSRGSISVNARVTSRSIVNDQANVTTVDGKRSASSGRTHTAEVFGRLKEHNEREAECRERYTKQEVTDRFKHIKTRMFNKSEIYEEKEYQAFAQSIDVTKESVRVPFAAELRTGYDATAYQQRKVQYGKLTTKQKIAMQKELGERKIPFDDKKDGITKLIKLLKESIRGDWILQNPGVDVKVFDKDDQLTKYFTPRTPYENFGYKIIQ